MLRVRPDDAELHDDVALLYLRTGQRERAADHFQTSLSIKSASASAHFNYATALTVSGRVDEAIESYRRALGIDPRHSHAHNNLGSVLSALGDYVGALRHFDRAIALDPANAQAHTTMQKDWRESCGKRSHLAPDRISRGFEGRNAFQERRMVLPYWLTPFTRRPPSSRPAAS